MVVVVQGEMPGAAMLAARAAMHGGAGYVVLAGRDPHGPGPDALVRRQIADLDELIEDDRIGALLIGPGLGRNGRAWVDAAVASDLPLVLDGDALTLIGRDHTPRQAPTILTPHSGEFVRMFDMDGDKPTQTLAAARKTGATIVHKGAETVIASPTVIATNEQASPWLSTAGTGDVLAGLVAARLAGQGADPFAAACQGVWLHTRIADLAGPAFIADDIIPLIPRAIAECLTN
ncbi:NAD(P)H-hydrate dehydratase [Sphingomonas gilva]|uniref:NAD(P)H-hydrate dehydratase n=2 Tax=Sphingomonas gilva TaxID=2305907 RepID=A0A396RPW5_9SPHN|nr:NAD(P)H-hydrate dehydratase [Sphingomonas gilva]